MSTHMPPSSPLLSLRRAVAERIVSASYMRKWLVLGVLIGAVAGLGAVVFVHALDLATHFFLGVVGGYAPPTPANEGGVTAAGHFARAWAIPLVVASGALVSALLVDRFAPEAAGHGTDAAIKAVHNDPKGIRPKTSLVKIVASAVTIGMGAGIGAIFRTPLGGAVLSAEILYLNDFETAAIVPGLVSSIVGFVVYGAVEGFAPIFGYHASLRFDHPIQLAYYAIIGVLAALTGLLYNSTFWPTHTIFGRSSLPSWARPVSYTHLTLPTNR